MKIQREEKKNKTISFQILKNYLKIIFLRQIAIVLLKKDLYLL